MALRKSAPLSSRLPLTAVPTVECADKTCRRLLCQAGLVFARGRAPKVGDCEGMHCRHPQVVFFPYVQEVTLNTLGSDLKVRR